MRYTFGIMALAAAAIPGAPISASADIARNLPPMGHSLAPVEMVADSGITAKAQKVFTVVDLLDVEHHWPAGEHVSWRTGVPDGKPEKTEGKHTHCSAFVASAAEHLGIYILRPPEHGQILLANAQHDWLLDEGAAQGWVQLGSGAEAQRRTNDGWFVVASYKNHNDTKPGHIAIVRPAQKSAAEIGAEGPQVTQAGGTNYQNTSLAQGFAGHPHAFQDNEVVYFAHAISPDALK